MSDTETSKPRRKARKAAAFADDWPDVTPEASAAQTSEVAPERQRIARAMARAGLCSRRDAEAWIMAGRVKVNGELLTSPARDIGPDDLVEVDDEPLPEAEKTRLFLFHKPRGLVTSDHDPEGRETVTDYLRENWPKGPRVVTIGRLDINTEGLLLLTNDGGLARQLELPKTGWLRRYRVRANGETDQAKLDALAAGISIDGVDYAGIEAKLDRVQGANCWLTMGLREGKNREIKRVLEHLGLEVNRLIRLSFGPFQLLDLEEGAVEEVRTRVLKDQLGEALAAEAGVDFGDAPVPDAAPAKREAAAPAKRDAATPAKREAKVDKSREAKPARTQSKGEAPRQRREAPTTRPGEQGLRRRTPAFTPKTETRDDRQPGRPRRHVSSLRSARAEDVATGPRKRIERTDTRDRNDRTVTVERKVATRPARSMSPSAEGKRARIARSGGDRRPEEGADRREQFGGRGAGSEARGTGRPPRSASGGHSSGAEARGTWHPPRSGSGGRSTGAETRGTGRPPRSGSGGRAAQGDTGTDRRTERPRGERPSRTNTGSESRAPRTFAGKPRERSAGQESEGRSFRAGSKAKSSKPFSKPQTARGEGGAAGRGAASRTPRGAGGGFKGGPRPGGTSRPPGGGSRPAGGGSRTPGGRPPRGGKPGGAPGRGKR